jgi:formylmethanofuran dehydrogenase subunit E-like metal-binding protein
MVFGWSIDLDNENDNDNDDDDIGIPTADCWFIRQSKQEQQSSIVIIAYDQFNAVNQQVRYSNK